MNTYSIGIDIGGTNTDIGLVRDDGRCMTKKNLPTNKYFDASLYVADICEQIKYLMAENHVDTIDGIGIAAPAGNYYTGCIENATNHQPQLQGYRQSWLGIPLAYRCACRRLQRRQRRGLRRTCLRRCQRHEAFRDVHSRHGRG